MENCWKNDLLIGIYSGLIVSISLWVFHLISQSIKIIRPIKFEKNRNRIKIKNHGLIFSIGYMSIIGQVIFHEQGILKRYKINVDGEKEYLSPEKLCPQKSRFLSIDLTGCILGHNFQSFVDLQNHFPDSKLKVYITYFGKLTNIQKIVVSKLFD